MYLGRFLIRIRIWKWFSPCPFFRNRSRSGLGWILWLMVANGDGFLRAYLVWIGRIRSKFDYHRPSIMVYWILLVSFRGYRYLWRTFEDHRRIMSANLIVHIVNNFYIFVFFHYVTRVIPKEWANTLWKLCSEQCSFDGIEDDSHGLLNILLFEMLISLPSEGFVEVVCCDCSNITEAHLREESLET